MGLTELFIIAVGLSMDAFVSEYGINGAVYYCGGLVHGRVRGVCL